MSSPESEHSANGSFQRIPSESSLVKKNGEPVKGNKRWERSQSALELENKDICRGYTASTVDYTDTCSSVGGKVSEHSKVYWDLSKAEEEMPPGRQGKFKISLQTIHQTEEMKTSGSPSVSIQARLVRRMASETSMGSGSMELALPCPGSPTCTMSECSNPNTPSPTPTTTSRASFTFSCNQSKPNMKLTLSNAVPVLQENIRMLRSASSTNEQCRALNVMLSMIEQAWATPTIGRDLAYGLCDVLKSDGGLEILIQNCDNAVCSNHEIQLGSAKVLEQSMTLGNRDFVAKRGLGVIVKLAKSAKDDLEMTKATTGILESLFKHSEDTCAKAIRFGGLDSILYSCRNSDIMTLRHCAVALANLAIFGGEDNQYEMIAHKVPEWLFPLAFSHDDSIRYYAFLAISTLSANKEIESAVAQSGTLELVEPFIQTHDPVEFANSDRAHIHGQSKDWLQRLVPLLESKRPEAQSLAAFHFAMEAGIKADAGKREIFSEIGAVEPLKRVASSTNKLASKFAAQALRIIGEEVPHKLSPQVPLWTTADVTHWLQQTGFTEFVDTFAESMVDGDLLLLLTEDNFRDDLHMSNGILRKRFIRELDRLKMTADYQSCDPSKLDDWLQQMGQEFRPYVYQMLKNGADKRWLRWLTEEHLLRDCGIANGIHRLKIIEGAKRITSLACSPVCCTVDGGPLEKSIDCFISYRRSNGSQLASLLKVHLQLRGFTVFLDIEKLRAGKFDDNLLTSVRNARNFVLVLTPSSLDRCIGDSDHKDWVHREVVAAIEGGCNIIPVMDSFQWPAPESLPEDMRAICYFNGIRWIHDYQDACVEKLEKFISGELSTRATSGGFRPTLSKGSSLNSATELHGPMFRMGSSLDCLSPPVQLDYLKSADCCRGAESS